MTAIPTTRRTCRSRGTAAAVAAIILLLSSGCATPVPDDGASARFQRFDGVRGVRYCEVFLIGGDRSTGMLKADLYNTTGLHRAADPRDSCPAGLWHKVDPAALKQEYGVLGVFRNGPRRWASDWFRLPVGTERDFNGLKARWMGRVRIPKGVDFNQQGSSAYRPTTVARKSEIGFAKGRPIFILIGPDGMRWIMHSWSSRVDPSLGYDDLARLGERLELPPGWTFRVEVLERELTVRAIAGYAKIVQDDLESTYDACFATACNYRP